MPEALVGGGPGIAGWLGRQGRWESFAKRRNLNRAWGLQSFLEAIALLSQRHKSLLVFHRGPRAKRKVPIGNSRGCMLIFHLLLG